jgi:hypothetical protein
VNVTITVTDRKWSPDQTMRALYYLHDFFRLSDEEGGGDVFLKAVIPEPIRFARYLLDNPEKWKKAQEIAEQAEKWFEAQKAERERQK